MLLETIKKLDPELYGRLPLGVRSGIRSERMIKTTKAVCERYDWQWAMPNNLSQYMEHLAQRVIDHHDTAKLRKALEFYADERNWQQAASMNGFVDVSPVELDQGEEARAALDMYEVGERPTTPER